MHQSRVLILMAVMLVSAASLLAQNKPGAREARDVIDYYLLGQGQGPILMDSHFCHTVVDNECGDQVAADQLVKGEGYNVWFRFLVPQGEEVSGIKVEFLHAGEARLTRELSASGSIRYRTWRFIRLPEAGEWQMRVSYPHGDGTEVLLDQPLTVLPGE